MNQIDDGVLVELAVSKNDQRAFSELVNRHQSNLRYSMRQLTGWNEALADDLTQDAFVQAFKELHRFRKQAKFSSWLYRIGYNTFLQFVRKKQLDVQSLEEQTHETELMTAPVSGKAETDLHKKVAGLLAALEPERRSVLHLLLHRQCTQQEISTLMGIPLGTVKTHINRGRTTLQSGLKGWQE